MFLVYKLKTFFKITGNALKWFISYLINRTSAVIIDGVYSSYTSPIFGVPQSSILGPLLFILYINELTSLGEEFGITINSYADDTTLYIGLNTKLEFYTVKVRFHYERGKEHSLFVLLIFFALASILTARFNRRSIKKTKNALFHARSGNGPL